LVTIRILFFHRKAFIDLAVGSPEAPFRHGVEFAVEELYLNL
jgi:hypothetical protein